MEIRTRQRKVERCKGFDMILLSGEGKVRTDIEKRATEQEIYLVHSG